MSAKVSPDILLEAILFSTSQPLKLTQISKILNQTTDETASIISSLEAKLHQRGIELIHGPDGYELEVSASVRQQVSQALAEQAPPLSSAALEVLTIIAYNQPVTKAQIDDVRGIASDASVRTLLARDLIVASGKQDGSPQYRTTNQFLKSLGLTHIDQLPPLAVQTGSNHATE